MYYSIKRKSEGENFFLLGGIKRERIKVSGKLIEIRNQAEIISLKPKSTNYVWRRS